MASAASARGVLKVAAVAAGAEPPNGASARVSIKPAPCAPPKKKPPNQEPKKAVLPPPPPPPAMAIERMPQRPADEHERSQAQEDHVVEDQAERQHREQHGSNRRRMPDRDRNERQQHDSLASAVQAQRDRE